MCRTGSSMDTGCITMYILLVMAIRASPTKADIWPAEISGSTAVKAGRDIQLKCRISDKMDHFNQVNMYLCKNGVGVQMGLLVNEKENKFILRNVSVLDSENLSKNQENPVPFQFNPDIWPAEISGSTAVKAGRDIQLKCRISDKMDHFNQVNMYLCKNGVGVQMGLLVNEKENKFILRNVSVLDSGNYSCVYSLTKYPLRNLRASEQKSIQVQVTENLSKNQENPVPFQFNQTMSKDGQTSVELQFIGFLQAHYMEIVLVSVVLLLLIGIIILCYKVSTFNKLRNDQGQRQKTDGDGLSDSDVIYLNENKKNAPFQPEPTYANA
ncbi:hypothetical protein MHYP_G00121340 [Metynnis hypsauchen]